MTPPNKDNPNNLDTEAEWQERWWSRIYFLNWKEFLMMPFFKKYEAQMWDLMYDVGSWIEPITRSMSKNMRNGQYPNRRIVLADIAWPDAIEWNCLRLRYNIEDIVDHTRSSTQDALAKVTSYLETTLPTETPKLPHPTTMVFSDVLNYVDYKRVLKWSIDLLASGWLIMICNEPGKGIQELISENGVKNNETLLKYLRNELHLDILDFDFEGSNIPFTTLTLVARKKR
jgi:hypothetical protein